MKFKPTLFLVIIVPLKIFVDRAQVCTYHPSALKFRLHSGHWNTSHFTIFERCRSHPMSEAAPRFSTCKIFLIRHGETTDNTKGLYAGSRDSALTSHGVQQAERLGGYFAKRSTILTHILSSDLSRALKTAQCIISQQPDPEAISIVTSRALREQDFGYLEGKSYHRRPSDLAKNGRDFEQDENTLSHTKKDVESKEALTRRAKQFLSEHLSPILTAASIEKPLTVAVVSHGMLLAALWKTILAQQSQASVTIAPEVTDNKNYVSLGHLGAWSNTGYLELIYESDASEVNTRQSVRKVFTEQSPWRLHIAGVNKRDHLNTLKRTRGGVGSSKHDETQKKIVSFFKKAKET